MKRLIPLLLFAVAAFTYQATNISTSGTLPANCTVGNVYVKTGASAGFYVCLVTDTWTLLSAGGSGDVTAAANIDDNAIVRGDGGTKGIQETGILIDDGNIIAFPDGVKQTFNPNGTNAGFNVGSQAGDPSSLANGDLWYDSTNNTLDARINGATVSLGAGGGGAVGDLEDVIAKVKASDEMVESSVTIQNDDDLFFAVGTSQTWEVDVHLFVTTENNNEGVDWLGGFTFPSGTTLSVSQNCMGNTATAVGGVVFFASAYRPSSGAANLLCGVLSTADTPASPVFLRAVVISGGTSGDVRLQWSQNSSSVDGVIVKADSRLIARRIQ